MAEQAVNEMTNLKTLRNRLLSLRRQTLSLLASRPEDESLDAGLLAIEEAIETDGPGDMATGE